MIKLTLIGMAAAGFVGYYAEGPVLLQTENQDQYYSMAHKAMSDARAIRDVETKGDTFAQNVREFQAFAKSGTFDSEQVVTHRDRIRSSFEEAFTAIERVEAHGYLEQTEASRSVMQQAIEEYMEGRTIEKTPEVTHDLEAYSRFMTETFIARSLRLAAQ